MNWTDFARTVPDFAAAGKRLLTPSDDVSIGFLATIGDSLHLAPVCPIFSDAGVYLSVGASTPKRADLERDGRYVLHAFLAANDEEFRIGGRAAYVAAEADRSRVHAAIRFGAFDRTDPVFVLDIEESMWGYWENAGRPGTRPIRRVWRNGALIEGRPPAPLR
jgi:hypothetical protein